MNVDVVNRMSGLGGGRPPSPARVWAKGVGVATVSSIGVGFVAWVALAVGGLPAALAVATTVAGFHGTFTLVGLLTMASGRFPGRLRLCLHAALWVAMVVVLVSAGLSAVVSGPPALMVLGGLAVGAAAAPAIYHSTRRGLTMAPNVYWRTWSVRDAADVAEVFRKRLVDDRVVGDARVAAEIGWARAQTTAAMYTKHPDLLDEARAVLDRIARDLGQPRGIRFAAACALVEAKDMQGERHRDGSGYAEALGLQHAIAAEPGASPDDLARALHDQGDFHLFRSREAGDAGDDPVPELRAALGAYRESRRLFAPDSLFLPMLRLKLAETTYLLAKAEAVDDPASLAELVDQQIDDLRAALPLFRGRRRTGREVVELSLAMMLLLRAGLGEADAGPAGLAEAERIARRLARRRGDWRGMAHQLLAEILQQREHGSAHTQKAQRRLQELEHAFDELRRIAVADASEAGLAWAQAAAEYGEAKTAARAYATVARQISTDVLRRVDFGKRVALVATRQGTATEAGFWLARTGQPEAAVSAIEDARAILLGLRAQRLPGDLERRLVSAGRAELFRSYRTAVEALDHAERAQHTEHGDDRTATYYARGAFDRVAREVHDLLGDDLGANGHVHARRAAASGPVVYFACAARAGYALIVPPAGPVLHRELPRATQDELHRRLKQVALVRRDPKNPDARLADVLAWAWVCVMSAVVELLPHGTPVTLVPLGGLGLIPLHAAGTGDSYVDDHLVVRYAPSARMALRARDDAAAADQHERSLAAVAASRPTEPGCQELVHADDEVRAVCARFGPHAGPILDADHDTTRRALARANVWHLACHGKAVETAPLDSCLVLTDRRLTLREVIADGPGRHRLAVLSACESGVPDVESPDEVIGFPGALLQAGVAGVVASSWPVGDTAALALVLSFHDLWRAGHPPATALTLAQRWLRTVTVGELAEHFGGAFRIRPGIPENRLQRVAAQRPFEHPRHWAAFTFTGF